MLYRITMLSPDNDAHANPHLFSLYADQRCAEKCRIC
jgi:hypothetical protein